MRSLFFRLYLFLILTFVGLGWSLDRLYDANIQQSNLTTDLDLHQGTLFLLNRELGRLPPQQQRIHLQALEASFGYPIKMLPFPLPTESDIPVANLEQEQMTYLARGGIVTLFDDTLGTSFFLQKLNQQDDVLVLGPIFNDSSEITEIGLTSVFLVGLALSVFIWVWPISRGIMRLSSTADEFGAGNLGIRLPENLSGPLNGLASHFNAMAARIEKLIQSHKSLSHAVSHELRTPIARIRFALEMVREAKDKATQDRLLNTMDKNIEELDGLVEELLIYARFDREEPQLNYSHVPVIPLISEVIAPYQQQYRDVFFSQRVETGEGVIEPNTLYCDNAAIARVIDNLVRNAVRYAKSHIEIAVKQTEKGKLFISVNDDGDGIPEHERANLFSPFVRLDDSRDRNSGGIGLGLAIVKRYVDLHKGRVYIDTSPIGGASFILEFDSSITN
ncbi:hypothetical protein DRW07_12720 [Alteromonas sediminis]|uniref:histidine kinase n=1 Tax=Alteromonas sediminis TaxID=2259342 RepID=A0A3N5XXH3_9ALTE|nr:ATP-binding protein [Alteromonas sediminis]RPJ65677.1 hypothetical protein DRW07_12720 [Alteromonas sediminis]